MRLSYHAHQRGARRSGLTRCTDRAVTDKVGRMKDWRENLVSDAEEIAQILRACRRIAVLGIKPESRAAAPAFFVPEYMLRQGYDVVPVPVYYPDVVEILGRRVYRSLRDIPGPIDMVNVFRRPRDIPPHVVDILATRPRVVWFQLGIRHDEAAETLARAEIRVVQDHCLLVEHRRLA
jgi:predicted CoA-binding protein